MGQKTIVDDHFYTSQLDDGCLLQVVQVRFQLAVKRDASKLMHQPHL